MPLDQRSVIPSVTGVPWWGAFACAAIATIIGYLVDSLAGTELTMFFSTMFLVGCLVAVLMVQNKSLFTAMVQPPLIMVIAVPLAYKSFTVGPSQGLKSLVLDLALPLIDRFPTMVFTTIAVWIIGAFRLTLYIQEKRGKAVAAGSRRAPRRTSKPATRGPAAAESESARAAAMTASAASSRIAASQPTSRRAADGRQAGQVRRAPTATPSSAPLAANRTPVEAPAAEPQHDARRATAPYGSPDPRTQERPDRPRRDEAQPARSAQGHRYAEEPSTGRRRRQSQESVREFADRQGETPRYRASRQEPARPTDARPVAARPRPEPNVIPEPRQPEPKLPNVRYRGD